MFERFADSARAVVVAAEQEARGLGHGWIGTEHLLLALMTGDGVAHDVLAAAGQQPEVVRAAVRTHAPAASGFSDADVEALRAVGIDLHEVLARLARLGDLPCEPEAGGRGRLRFTRRAKKVLELSVREAVWLHSREIGTEHLLLGLLREGEGLGALVLRENGADLDALRRATLRSLTDVA